MATLTPLTSFFSSLAMGQTEVHDPSKPIHVGRIRLLLLFPIVIMAIIVTTYALYTWLRPGRAAAAASRRRPRPAAFNQITSASSLLDTHGNTLTPWKGSRPHAPRMASTEKSSDPEGWFNLVLVRSSHRAFCQLERCRFTIRCAVSAGLDLELRRDCSLL